MQRGTQELANTMNKIHGKIINKSLCTKHSNDKQSARPTDAATWRSRSNITSSWLTN